MLLPAVLPPRPPETSVLPGKQQAMPRTGIVGVSAHAHIVAAPQLPSGPAPVRSSTHLLQRTSSGVPSLSSLSASLHFIQAPVLEVAAEPTDMKGLECSQGDKRKHDEVAPSVVALPISTPGLSESEDDQPQKYRKKRDAQDNHTEDTFRERLAKESIRSSSARSARAILTLPAPPQGGRCIDIASTSPWVKVYMSEGP